MTSPRLSLRTVFLTPQAPEVELDRMRTVSRFMDEAVRIPGIGVRVGADSVVGLLPVGGDLLGAVVSAFIVYRAYLLGVPRAVLVRMVMNVVLDTVVGSVPVLGDLFDVAWKANERNVALVERWVASTGHDIVPE